MKKLSFLLLFIFISSVVFAQTTTTNPIAPSTPKKVNKDKGDRLVLDIFSDFWQQKPAVDAKKFNPSANVMLFKDFPINKSPISFAVGLGIDAHNFNSNGVVDTLSGGRTIFFPLSAKLNDVDSTTRSYSKNKMTVAYLDLPIEFRFRTKNETGKKFKFALGFKAGVLINKHTKYKGNYVDQNTGTVKTDKVKSHYINNLESFRYGVSARVGYGMYNLMFFYSLSTLFEKDKGPEMFPVSVGISLTPFN
jgi:hypothetical protein